MTNLVDSGVRHEFKTGGMREIVDGKGRCDLLPLDVVSTLFGDDEVLLCIHNYIYTGKEEELFKAIRLFVDYHYKKVLPEMMLELAKHYEDGNRNWQKGLPLHSFIDSGVRHYLKYLSGFMDEPHDRAFLWNMVGAIWTQKHVPSMVDLPFGETKPYEDKAVQFIKEKTGLDKETILQVLNADVKIGLDMASQPDFSSCMNPPIEEEIYIEDILTRADVMWYSDMINGSRVVKSRNTKEPLTEKEQKCLERMWRDQGFEGDVIFYVGEEKLNEQCLQTTNPSF